MNSLVSTIPDTMEIVSGGPYLRPAMSQSPHFRPVDHLESRQLETRYSLLDVAGEGTDFERARRINQWVRRRWNHGWDNEGQLDALSILARAEQGGTFNCGFYTRAFVPCCLAVGIPARRVGVFRKGVEFQDTNKHNEGHAVSEVYCREFDKWVILDTDMNAFYMLGDVPLGAVELHRAWHRGSNSKIQRVLDKPYFVEPETCPSVSKEYLQNMWVDFNRHQTIDYYYFVRTNTVQGYGHPPNHLKELDKMLYFAGETHPPLAFDSAGLDLEETEFVDDERQFNWPLDRTYIQAQMEGPEPTNQIRVQLDHDMPFFDHFEMKSGERPYRAIADDQASVYLERGTTRIAARCVDSFGRPGTPATLEISLKPASPSLIARRSAEYWK